MNNLTLNEQLDLEYWFVLHKIAKESGYRLKDKHIRYEIYYPPKSDEVTPFPINEYKILQLLQEEQVLTIYNPDNNFSSLETELAQGIRKFIMIIYLETLPKFKQFYKKYEIRCQKIKSKLDTSDPLSYFGFDDMVFWLNKAGGGKATISFNPGKNRQPKDPYYLFYALIKILKEQGEREGSWLKAQATTDEIIRQVKFLRYPNPDKLIDPMYWVKNTRNNLVNKVLNRDFSELITISNQNRKGHFYPIAIKLPL